MLVLLTAHTQVITALGMMRVSEIRRHLDPHLLPIAKYLSLVDEGVARARKTREAKERLGVNE